MSDISPSLDQLLSLLDAVQKSQHQPGIPDCHCIRCAVSRKTQEKPNTSATTKPVEQRKRKQTQEPTELTQSTSANIRSPSIKRAHRAIVDARSHDSLSPGVKSEREAASKARNQKIVEKGVPPPWKKPVETLVRKGEDIEVLIRRGYCARKNTTNRIISYIQKTLIAPARVHNKTPVCAPQRQCSVAERYIKNSLGLPRTLDPSDPLDLKSIKPTPSPAAAAAVPVKKCRSVAVQAAFPKEDKYRKAIDKILELIMDVA